jgi:hypothetical protein
MRYFIHLVFAFQTLTAFAQSEKLQGIWYGPNEEVPLSNWKAEWIWMDEAQDSDVMLARKVFDVTTNSNKAILRISASTQYQLFINGKYILRGPARSAAHHQSFDILDVSKQLRIGENTIAVRVHYQRGAVSYQHEGRPGLLLQLDDGKNKTVSDSNWRVSPDTSWDNEAPRINRFQLAVNDRVDLRNEIRGWQELEFDDSNWMPATPLMRNVGWPSPQKNSVPNPLTPPWTSLVPRDIPYLLESEEPARNLIQATEIDFHFLEGLENLGLRSITQQIDKKIAKSAKDFTKERGPLIIPASEEPKSWLLLFDFGTVLNGMAQLNIQGLGGTKIAVLSAPFVVDNKFTHEVVASKFIDEIVLSGKRDTWEATYFKPTRYMAIAVQSGNEPVSIYNAGIRQFSYPFNKSGMMISPDAPWVEQYFNASAKTIETCTTDAYTDNYRERRQYAQTGYYAALGNYWTFGDIALQRRYLVQVAQEQKANGVMPAYAPLTADDYMVILDSNCLYIRSLHNYFLYSGDIKTTLELLPAAKNLMELLHSYADSMGMINNPPYPYWLDHAVNDRRGVNLNLNGHYLGALEDFAKILDWVEDGEQENYIKRAKLLRKSIKSHLWDETKGLFADARIDRVKSDLFSEHANAMALSLKIADSVEGGKIAKKLLSSNHDYIKNESGITLTTPAMSYFLYKGLCEYGYVDEAFQMFRNRFDKMLRPGTNQTLWEEWWLDGTGRSGTLQKTSRSDAQTESAFPQALFSEYIVGIKPIKPGMKELVVALTKSDIHRIEARVPSPEGNLLVKWGVDKKGRRSLKLEVPGEMKVNLDVESLGALNKKSISINGNVVALNPKEDPYIQFVKGKHHIQF